jgi:hypothetical protein
MEEWQKHVARTKVESMPTMSWCDTRLEFFDWYFISIDHAANSAGSRLQACPACMKAIFKALRQET